MTKFKNFDMEKANVVLYTVAFIGSLVMLARQFDSLVNVVKKVEVAA